MVSDAVILGVVAAIPPTIVALGSVVLNLQNRKKLDRVSTDVNGRMTELLDEAKSSSRKEGELVARDHMLKNYKIEPKTGEDCQ